MIAKKRFSWRTHIKGTHHGPQEALKRNSLVHDNSYIDVSPGPRYAPLAYLVPPDTVLKNIREGLLRSAEV